MQVQEKDMVNIFEKYCQRSLSVLLEGLAKENTKRISSDLQVTYNKKRLSFLIDSLKTNFKEEGVTVMKKGNFKMLFHFDKKN